MEINDLKNVQLHSLCDRLLFAVTDGKKSNLSCGFKWESITIYHQWFVLSVVKRDIAFFLFFSVWLCSKKIFWKTFIVDIAKISLIL